MKRITALLLAFALMLGSVGAAEADGVDIKVKGQWDFIFGVTANGNWYNNKNRTNGLGTRGGVKVKSGYRVDSDGKVVKDDTVNNSSSRKGRSKRRDDDRFYARQRIRTQVNFITSEYLQAVLHFEIGDMDWGRPGKGRQQGAGIDTDGVNIETKHAYLDWLIPETDVSVRMGLQRVALPSTRLANPILDADVAGIVVSSPITDWLGVTALWARPFDQYKNDNSGLSYSDWGNSLSDESDVFGVILPMSFSDFGTSISPYFLYGFIGGNSGHVEYMFNNYDADGDPLENTEKSKAKAWWAGTNITFDLFDPLVASVDVAYGHLNRAEYSYAGALNQKGDTLHAGGWFIAGTLDYKMDWMTPGIFGWWGSGDKKKDLKNGRIGRMPFVGNDGGNFSPTSFGTAGYYGIGNAGNNQIVSGTGLGTWGVGIQVADVSFIEDLSHTLRFAYYQGTNGKNCGRYALRRGFDPAFSSDNIYMTTKDKAFEVNFDHEYKIYENLTAVLELGYVHLKSSKDSWGGNNKWTWGRGSGLKENSNAYKAELNFRYKF
ncbi:outer membrane homotrimeric porin [Desulfovibrio sp. OttesenSCG-928-G15]|nr:outer membrane homotrimeric porin [Desulfovibrio sp. OttesenSCG-928-G15]